MEDVQGLVAIYTLIAELAVFTIGLIFAIIMICVQVSKGKKVGVKNKYTVWNYITAFYGYYVGMVACLSLVLIPLGIFLIIAGNRYSYWARVTEAELVTQKDAIKKWAIFISIVNFPIGLLSLIPLSAENTIKVTTVGDNTTYQSTTQTKQQTESRKEEDLIVNKEETIAKLKHLLDEGLITKEEYERAKSDVINEVK